MATLRRFGGLDNKLGCCIPKRRKNKGRKKKFRRSSRANFVDGWERKKSNGLRPAEMSSKKEFRKIIAKHEIYELKPYENEGKYHY